jgi:hypothetical protein
MITLCPKHAVQCLRPNWLNIITLHSVRIRLCKKCIEDNEPILMGDFIDID